MSYTVLLLSKARRELSVAFEWYEERQNDWVIALYLP